MPRTSKITKALCDLYEQCDKSLDDSEAPARPPEFWQNTRVGKYCRPIKTAISLRIEAHVLAGLKSKGEGHLSRSNEILRQAMLADQRGR